jgi:hypothetical protein
VVSLVGQGTLRQGFGRGDQVEYGTDTIVGRLDGLDGLAHFVLPNGQVAGTLGVTLGREKAMGSSSAELTFLPLDRRFWVTSMDLAVL